MSIFCRKFPCQVALTNSSTSSKSPVLFVAFASILCPLPQNVGFNMYHGSDCYRIHTAPWSMAISLKRVACFQPLLCKCRVLLNCIRSTWKFQTTSLKRLLLLGIFQNASTNRLIVCCFFFGGQPVSLCSGPKKTKKSTIEVLDLLLGYPSASDSQCWTTFSCDRWNLMNNCVIYSLFSATFL